MELFVDSDHVQTDFLDRLAANIAKQFGRNCEVAIHEFQGDDLVITHIENGYITGRNVGDLSTSEFLDEFFEKDFMRNPVYHMKSRDGRDLLSSTTYIQDGDKIKGFVCINYDISELQGISRALDWAIADNSLREASDVNDILEYHLNACQQLIGKTPDNMDRADKFRAVEYLESKHVFLITKSSVRVCEYLNITKYSLYTFLDEIRKAK